MREHLKRNGYAFEIYTRVDYKMPTDIFNGSSDFDILALVNNKILTVECKFSKIDERNRRTVKDVIQKSNGLQKVVSVTEQKFDYLPVLIYNKEIAKPIFLDRMFGNTDFHLIDIGDLRSSIVSVFEDKPKELKEPKPLSSVAQPSPVSQLANVGANTKITTTKRHYKPSKSVKKELTLAKMWAEMVHKTKEWFKATMSF